MDSDTLNALLTFFPVLMLANGIEVTGIRSKGPRHEKAKKELEHIAVLGTFVAALGAAWTLAALIWSDDPAQFGILFFVMAVVSIVCAVTIGLARVADWSRREP